MPTSRLTAALRVLARRRAYLGAMAGAGLLLTFAAVLLAVFAGAVAALTPPAWGLGVAAAAVGLVMFLGLWVLVLGFLRTAVRAYTVFAAGPMPTSSAGIVGGTAGLGLFLLARRLRARRGILSWIVDPYGSAARVAVNKVLPPEHPLQALLQVAGLEPRRPPTRGVGLMSLGLVLTGAAVALIATVANPGLGSLVVALLAPFVVLAGVLHAGTKGVLEGAWDRYLMDQMAQQADEAVASVAGTVGGAFRGLGGTGRTGGGPGYQAP